MEEFVYTTLQVELKEFVMGKTEVGTVVFTNGGAGVIGGSLIGQIFEHMTKEDVLIRLGELQYEVDHTLIIPVPGWNIEVYSCKRFTL
jgi:FlaA1/EpsC-like NDP-sugar epimerase